MKKIFLIALMALGMFAMPAEAQESLPLPQPKTVNVTLTQALTDRHSTREFADKEIPDDILSTVLWAGAGVNRKDGGLTAPSAINAKDIIIYVVRKDGAYKYDAKANALVKVSDKDLRKAVAGRQAFVESAPVSLVLVSDHSKFGQLSKAAPRMGVADAGYVSQNICLICSALGLNTVPRMTMDVAALKEALGLDDNYDFILNNPIGYPVK